MAMIRRVAALVVLLPAVAVADAPTARDEQARAGARALLQQGNERMQAGDHRAVNLQLVPVSLAAGAAAVPPFLAPPTAVQTPATTPTPTPAPYVSTDAGTTSASEASSPFYRAWWFWTAAGVVVGGAVVLEVAASAGGDEGEAAYSGDVARVPVP
jgi:hypothetical protein